MWPRGPAFEPRCIVQIRPMAARMVAKVRVENIARADYCWSQLFKPEGMSLDLLYDGPEQVPLKTSPRLCLTQRRRNG